MIAFSGLDYTGADNISITKESEEPKPKDGKAFADLIEESKFSPKEANKTVFALMELMFPLEKSTIEEYKESLVM